jgi:hypothetical protein
LKKPACSVRFWFYNQKPKNQTEPKPIKNRKKTEPNRAKSEKPSQNRAKPKKPSQTGKNRAKTEKTELKPEKPSQTGLNRFCPKKPNRTETGRFDPISVFFQKKIFSLIIFF